MTTGGCAHFTVRGTIQTRQRALPAVGGARATGSSETFCFLNPAEEWSESACVCHWRRFPTRQVVFPEVPGGTTAKVSGVNWRGFMRDRVRVPSVSAVEADREGEPLTLHIILRCSW